MPTARAFIVLHESTGSNGESLWQNQSLTSTHLGVTKTLTFASNLPSASTAGKRVLVATQGFAALGLVTPDYVIQNGFLATDGGTLSYASVDQVTYTALPVDGVHAIDRTGASIQNVATNFAGRTGSVALASTPISPAVGLWWNPDESGTGYNFDVKHGVLVVTIFTYDASGHSECTSPRVRSRAMARPRRSMPRWTSTATAVRRHRVRVPEPGSAGGQRRHPVDHVHVADQRHGDPARARDQHPAPGVLAPGVLHPAAGTLSAHAGLVRGLPATLHFTPAPI